MRWVVVRPAHLQGHWPFSKVLRELIAERDHWFFTMELVEGCDFLTFVRPGSPGFQALASEKSPLIDSLASIIGHGLATRFPRLRFMPVEIASSWVRPFLSKLRRVYEASPTLFDEDPFEVFTRNVWIHIFHEADPKGLIDMGLPADHLMFGSDFPHPEGLGDPLAYSEVVESLSAETQALIMGGTLAQALKVGEYAA